VSILACLRDFDHILTPPLSLLPRAEDPSPQSSYFFFWRFLRLRPEPLSSEDTSIPRFLVRRETFFFPFVCPRSYLFSGVFFSQLPPPLLRIGEPLFFLMAVGFKSFFSPMLQRATPELSFRGTCFFFHPRPTVLFPLLKSVDLPGCRFPTRSSDFFSSPPLAALRIFFAIFFFSL